MAEIVIQINSANSRCTKKKQVCLNLEKTETMLLTTKNYSVKPTYVKFLDILIDPQLWHHHVAHISKILCSAIYLFRNLKREVAIIVILKAYFSFFQTHLNYGLLLWVYSSTASRLFALQSKVLRREDCRHFFKFKIISLPSILSLDAWHFTTKM